MSELYEKITWAFHSRKCMTSFLNGSDRAACQVKDERVFPFVIHGSPTECATIAGDLLLST